MINRKRHMRILLAAPIDMQAALSRLKAQLEQWNDPTEQKGGSMSQAVWRGTGSLPEMDRAVFVCGPNTSPSFLTGLKDALPGEVPASGYFLSAGPEDVKTLDQLKRYHENAAQILAGLAGWQEAGAAVHILACPEALDIRPILAQWSQDFHEELEPNLKQHLQRLVEDTRFVKLPGIQDQSGRANRIPLERVYIRLQARDASPDVAGRKGKEGETPEEEDVSTVIREHGQLLITGDPGCGKSTLLSYYALKAARALLGHPGEGAQAGWSFWSESGTNAVPVPFLITCKDLVSRRGEDDPLLSLLAGPMDGAWVEALFRNGSAAMLVDGLDEVLLEEDRRWVCKQVHAFLSGFGDAANRLVLTCREKVFEWDLTKGLRLELKRYTVQPMDRKRRNRFLEDWFAAVAAVNPRWVVEPEEKAAALVKALDSQEKVAEMGRNPNLLTLIAVIQLNEGRLPELRVELYQKALHLFLRGKDREDGRPSWDSWQMKALEETLMEAALEMLRNPDKVNQIPILRSKLQTQLDAAQEAAVAENLKLPPSALETQAGAIIHWLLNRLGLLISRQKDSREVLAFVHQGYQEYLAGLQIQRKACQDRNPIDAAPEKEAGALLEVILEDLKSQKAFWGETHFLLLTRLGRKQTFKDWEEWGLRKPSYANQDVFPVLIGRLLEWGADKSNSGETRGRVLALAMATLAALECAPKEKNRRHSQLDPCRKRVLGMVEDDDIPVTHRIEAFRHLGVAGDPRLGLEKQERWCYLNRGRFTMGSQEGDPDEKPLLDVDIVAPFWMGAYPVTNAEFEPFVKHGYDQEAWWDPQAWDWIQKEKIKAPGFWERPEYRGANAPVVGVSWWEARAFCRWLGHGLKGQRWFPENGVAALPLETQWEYAAAGTASRRYAWGPDDPTPGHANFDFQEHGPTPVGVYGKGKAENPGGPPLYDLAGNVWEWCENVYQADAYQQKAAGCQDHPWGKGEAVKTEREAGLEAVRALRGGSWVDSASRLRCACRSRYRASYRSDYAGFRCVVLLPPEP